LEIRKASETKIQLYKKWLNSRNQFDRQKYKSYIKLYNNLVNKTQREYFSTTFNSKINSSKKIWNEINKLCSLGAHRASAGFKISKLVVNGQTVTDSVNMAEEFNNYFCSVGSELANNLPHNDSIPDFLDFMTPSVLNSFVCETISQTEVYNVIVKLATKSSSGPDEFGAKLILEVALFIIPTLCYIFNLSLSSGIFPSALKIAKIIPIFKKGSHSVLGNYRPISLLKIFGKILEHIVSTRVNSYFTKFHLFYDLQFGFRPKHSTKLALLNTVDDILTSLDNNNYVAGIFFDLSKAFDSINHTILVKKLEHYGIRGLMLNWFKSYLAGRSQYTCVNNCSSSLAGIDYGVVC